MNALAHPPSPIQHDTEHGGFKEKCGEYLICKQGARHIAHRVHEARPIGAKLKTHGDAAHNAQRKGQGKHLDPKLISIHPKLRSSGHEPAFEKK